WPAPCWSAGWAMPNGWKRPGSTPGWPSRSHATSPEPMPGRSPMGDMLLPPTLAAAFPGLAQRVHGHPLAYLDNGATTHMPLAVLHAMRDFEARDRANIHRGVHTLSQRATDDFEAARATLKRFVGAGPQHELVFTSGTTE